MADKQPDTSWEEFKAKVKQIWSNLTEEELNETEGDKEKVYEKIGERYGISRKEIDQRLNEQDI